MKRAAGVLTLVVFAGSPSLVAACAGLCAPSVAHGAGIAAHDGSSHDVVRGDEHTAHHHAVAQEDELHHAPQLQMTSTDRDCCAPVLKSLGTADAVLRAHSGTLLAVPCVLATVVDSGALHPANPDYVSPVPPPAPPRAPLILLI